MAGRAGGSYFLPLGPLSVLIVSVIGRAVGVDVVEVVNVQLGLSEVCVDGVNDAVLLLLGVSFWRPRCG